MARATRWASPSAMMRPMCRLPFPGGDVPMDRGVCTDVVVRAYRTVGVDLQLLVNQDMRKAFTPTRMRGGCQSPIRTLITGAC